MLVDKFMMEMAATAHLSGDGRLTAENIREYSSESERMSGEGRLSATYIREIRHSVKMSGEGPLSAEVTKFRLDFIEFTDTFKPGD